MALPQSSLSPLEGGEIGRFSASKLTGTHFQILESWRLRRLVDPSVVDEALQLLDQRRG